MSDTPFIVSRESAAESWALFERVRTSTPLVHNITNYVAMDVTANVLLAAGASPAMVHAIEEVDDFVILAGALTINIGTLSSGWIDSMVAAIRAARTNGTPWVLDPVGAGATAFRNRIGLSLASMQPTVIRANASEVLALSEAGRSAGKGVDSLHESDEALMAAEALARRHGCVVSVTGAIDYITDGTRMVTIANGHEMMTRVTALGCALTGLVGAFQAVSTDPLNATVAAMGIFALAGELAVERAEGPGDLRVHLINALYTLDRETALSRLRIGA